jgi:transcriptional regulator with XRE-family HTH domain
MIYSQELKGSTMPKDNHKESKAITKLRAQVEETSVKAVAEKLGIARGTLLGLLAGTTSPRLEVVHAAEKLGVKQSDWNSP